MKSSLALLLAPLAALAQHGAPLPEQELADNAVAAGVAGSDIPKAGEGLSTNALYCPVDFPRYCPFGFCCRTTKCCSLECCTEAATYCSYGRCYR